MRTPKSALYLNFAIATVRKLATASRLEQFERLFSGLPESLVPTHFSEDEPIRDRFDIGDISRLQGIMLKPGGADILFAMRGKSSGSMQLSATLGPRVDSNRVSYSIELKRDADVSLVAPVRTLFERMVTWADASWAGLGLACHVKGGGWQADYEPQGVRWRSVQIVETGEWGATLACLPSFKWITVLEAPYVRFLGEERLRQAPVFRAFTDDDSRLWLQFSQNPEEAFEPDSVALVERLRMELDSGDNFCRMPTFEERVSGGTKYRTPDLDRSELRDSCPSEVP